MEKLDLGLLLAKRRALVNEQKKLREKLKALADVVDHDESGKDWKTFPAAQIERNNKLRAICWSWQLRIDDIEREIYVIDEDIRVQMSMQQENDKRSALQEISDRLNYVGDDSDYLRMTEDAAKKLSRAQEILKSKGYGLKIWDAYRPNDAQLMLYDNYSGSQGTKGSIVATPKWKNGRRVGTSHHGSGKAVDLTLVDLNTGKELPMPTGFDDFSGNAEWEKVNKKRDIDGFKNAYILRDAMEQAGFYTIRSEWWHYQTNPPKRKAESVPH